MKTKTKLIAELPFFMGFYESMYMPEPDCFRDIESCNEKELIEYYPDEYKEYIKSEYHQKGESFASTLWVFNDYTYNGLTYKEFTKKVSENYTNEFFKMLKEHGIADRFGIKSLNFESLSSPTEYNFQTDRVFTNIDVDLPKFRQEFRKLAKENYTKFEAALEENFKSRSGFASFYSYCPIEWLVFDSRLVTSSSEAGIDPVMFEFYLEFIVETLIDKAKLEEMITDLDYILPH